jgi:spermidine synthase
VASDRGAAVDVMVLDPGLLAFVGADPTLSYSGPSGLYDVILCDLFARDVDRGSTALDPIAFLAPGGTCVASAAAVIAHPRPGVIANPLWDRVRGDQRFAIATPVSPGGYVAFKAQGPTLGEPLRAFTGQHYDPDVHRAAFALPRFFTDGFPALAAPLSSERPGDWWHEDAPETGISQALACSNRLEEKSPFQKLELFDHPAYGKVFALDGTIQGTKADEAIYHEMATHVAMSSGARPRKSVLVVGGGDGGIVREALCHEGVEKIVMVDIDARVIDLSYEHFKIQAPDDPRVETIVDDAAVYVRQAVARGDRFDVIVVDATDSTEPSQSLWKDEFFVNLRTLLSDDGVVVDSDILVHGKQGGRLSRDHEDGLVFVQRARKVFASVEGYAARTPTYPGGYFAFFLYTKDGKSCARPSRSIARRYYDPAVHAAAFALPPWWRKLLA